MLQIMILLALRSDIWNTEILGEDRSPLKFGENFGDTAI